jgi:outer membrane murein-binding lipoprotein Lpp
MGNELYGWSDDKQVVLDPDLLNEAAGRLKQQNSGNALFKQLQNALAPPGAFGQIEGGASAQTRLSHVLTSLQSELAKVGLDMEDLAARTLAAREMAIKANADTTHAANSGAPNGPR